VSVVIRKKLNDLPDYREDVLKTLKAFRKYNTRILDHSYFGKINKINAYEEDILVHIAQ